MGSRGRIVGDVVAMMISILRRELNSLRWFKLLRSSEEGSTSTLIMYKYQGLLDTRFDHQN